MIAYLISFFMLVFAIWQDKRKDFPDLDAALDSLTDFDFDKNWWISCDHSSALAIDAKQNKICLLRAFKGVQVIDYRQLLEFELEETSAKPPSSGIKYYFNSFFTSKSEYTKIYITLLLDDLNQFDFTLTIYYGRSVKGGHKSKSLAKQICKILKVVQKRAEKLEKQQASRPRIAEEVEYEEEELLEVDSCSNTQAEFDFEPA